MTAQAQARSSPGDTAVAELRSAIEALDAVIQVRLEERQGGVTHRPLAVDGADEGIPSLERFAGTGPLATAIAMAGLTAPEALILVAALAPSVDERFAMAYGLLTDRAGVSALTLEVARTLAARTFRGRLDASAMLTEYGTLRASAMLILEPRPDGSDALVPEPGLAAWVLGLPAPRAQATPGFPARPLTTVHTLDDVVLPGRARDRLSDLERRLAHREQVVERWGFARHHDNARGLVALFHGAPGTGKSMTAAAIAASAGLPAYIVDLSALVSKYIGETEKALSAVFDRAEREGSVLVFDEADAIFGSRTEVSDAHDRYANQEVSYLLSRVEAHPGVVILTTNLLGNIDSAFRRRVHVMVEFPLPGPAERLLLWERVLPLEAPSEADLGLETLAERHQLTGAEIRDAAIEAAYLAASEDGVITRDLLEEGIRRQFDKSGRTQR